ncbi:MAG: glutaredoxin family protein [Gammaproteobacteria bacterium]
MLKPLVRLFFKTVRRILGPVLLLWERLTPPKPVVRSAAAQARLDALTQGMVLYQYRTCPFCLKVRRTLARLALKVERRDAQHDLANRGELEQQGGQIKVPCLRLTEADGRVRWLYESDAIIRYLEALPDAAAG